MKGWKALNILFLTNLFPYPLDNGGKMKTYTTLIALKNAGHRIDLFCFRESLSDNEESELWNVCENIQQVFQKLTTAENKKYMMNLALRTLFSKYGLTIYKFISQEMMRCIEFQSGKKYDIIYFDHLQMCVYKDLCKKLWPEAKIVLDEHNCEAVILKRNAQVVHNPVKKVYLFYEAKKVERFEAQSICSADKVIVLSNADYDMLRISAKKNFNYSIIPIGVVDRGVKKQRVITETGVNILFVGTLTWGPNDQGLIWFLNNVIPRMEKKAIKYHFYIVGKNPSDEVKKKTEKNQHITVTGYVESVDKYYDLCECMVVPLFIGSGQRVKIIEAFSKGMPVVSTSIGAEGLSYTDGENIMIADNVETFVKQILQMEDEDVRKRLSQKERELYEKTYSPEVIQKNLIKEMEKLRG